MGCIGSKKDDINKERQFKAEAAKQQDGKRAAAAGAGAQTPVKGADNKSAPASGAPGGPSTPAPAGAGDDVHRTPAKGIATPNAPKPGQQAAKAEDDAANKIYSTSYTNKRTKEYDLLHRIVEQTQHNFIDVQNNKQPSLDEDAEDRGRAANKYKQLGDSIIGAGGILALDTAGGVVGGAPSAAAPAHGGDASWDVTAVKTGNAVSEADVTLITQSLDAVSAALAQALAVQPVGPIVLTFEELQKLDHVSAA